MFFVCVRTVFRDTTSSRAISGPPRSVASSRSTSSSRSLNGSISPRRSRLGRGAVASKAASSRRGTPARSRARAAASSSAAMGGALVDEDPDVTLGLGQRERALQRHQRRRAVAPSWRARACSTRISMTVRSCRRRRRPRAGGRGARWPARRSRRGAGSRAAPGAPGQGHVLELAEIAEVVLGRQPPLAGPREGVRQPSLLDPHPRPDGRDRAHVGREVADVDPLGVVEQVHGGVQVTFDLPDPGHRDPSPVGVLGHPEVLAQLLAPLQELARPPRGRRARSGAAAMPTYMSAVPRRTGPPCSRASRSALLVGAPSPRGDGPATIWMSASAIGAPHHVGDVAGAAQARHRLDVARLRLPRGPRSPRTRCR